MLGLLLLLTGLAALGPTRADAAQRRKATPLDLAAMALTPDDLAAEGLDGDGDPGTQLDLSCRTGRIYAGVIVVDVERAGEEPEEPTVTEAEVLASRMLDRIEAELEDEIPGVTVQIQRLMTSPDATIVTASDRYLALDGDALLRYGEDEAVFEERTEQIEADGLLDVFFLDGDTVFRVSAASEDGIDLETVLDLAADQADCLEDGDCVEPIPAPDGLLNSL